MPRLQFHLYINVERRLLTDTAGDPLGGDRLQEFFREEAGVLCFHCFRDDGSVWPFGGSDAFEFGAAADWDQETATEILSEDDQFNLAGDWDVGGVSQISPANGRICCRYNTNTDAFNALFTGDAEAADVGLYLKQIDPTNGNVTLCQYGAKARNIRRTDGTTPPGVQAPTYPTYVQMTTADAAHADLPDPHTGHAKTETPSASANKSGAAVAPDFAAAGTLTWALTGNLTSFALATNLRPQACAIFITPGAYTLPAAPPSGAYKGAWDVSGILVRIIIEATVTGAQLWTADSLELIA